MARRTVISTLVQAEFHQPDLPVKIRRSKKKKEIRMFSGGRLAFNNASDSNLGGSYIIQSRKYSDKGRDIKTT